MALNFPNTPANGQAYVDPTGQKWVYETSTNSWTAEGTSGGMIYKGGLDITATAPTGAQAGWVYTVTTGGAANASFTGIAGNIAKGTLLVFDGTNWQQQGGGSSTKIEVGNTKAEVVDTGTDGRFVVTTEGTPRATIDSSGRLLLGTPTSTLQGSGAAATQQIATFGTAGALAATNYGSGSAPYGSHIWLGASRGSTAGSATPVQSGDLLGQIRFFGGDGNDLDCQAAWISCHVDGTVGGDDLPGRLSFSTAADGVNAPTERMRIDSTGLVTLSGPGIKFPATQVASADPNTLDDYEEGTWTPNLENSSGTALGSAYNTRAGIYTKIGRVVYWNAAIDIATNNAACTGNIRIGGFPFNINASPGSVGGFYISFLSRVGANLRGVTFLSALVSSATTQELFYLNSSGNEARVQGGTDLINPHIHIAGYYSV